MPFRQRVSYGRRRGNSLSRIIDSNKNIVPNLTACVAGTRVGVTIAQAVDAPAGATAIEVKRGSVIKAMWLELWYSLSAEPTVGVSTIIDAYIWKNTGTNLTPPNPGTVGTSNEKKWVLKNWKGIVGARTQGFPAYTWKGWIKIPRGFQRMAQDDVWQLQFLATGTNGLACTNVIYKWYS